MASSGKKSALTRAKSDFTGTYLTVLGDADVLLGRGAPVRKREANQSYHELVKAQKQAYNATGKHAVKDEIARTIVDKVALKGGRFVRRVDTEEERLSLAIPEHVTDAWVVVSEDFAREKCKQSLRDAAASLKKPAALTTSRKRSTSPIPEDVALEIESGASRKVARPSAAGVPRKPRPMTNTDKLPAEPDTAEILPPQSVHYSPSSRPSAFLQQEATLELSQDLSFRLKHPSHRKRDMPRLRRMQEQREAAALPEASLLTGSLMKAEREPTRPARKRAIGQERSQYSTSSDSDNDLDQKPKACNQKN